MPNGLSQIVSVLIPAYNEAASIERVLARVIEIGPLVKEIIVVDDGSTDETAAVALRVARFCPLIQVHKFAHNCGKTAAIQHALDQATGEVIIVQDADLEYDPAEIPEVVAPIIRGDADVVFGSRFMVRRAARVLYFYHYVANKALTLVSNMLTNRNMSDIETCYKCFRAGVIKPLRLSSRGFGLEVEITAMVCKTQARTYEVPISYYGRTYQEGKKIGVRDGLAAIAYLFYYNMIAPWRHAARTYVAAVNQFLTQQPRFVVPASSPPLPEPLRGGSWPISQSRSPIDDSLAEVR
jgi:glycosyltransferase involved in cell wall biosynthesis